MNHIILFYLTIIIILLKILTIFLLHSTSFVFFIWFNSLTHVKYVVCNRETIAGHLLSVVKYMDNNLCQLK